MHNRESTGLEGSNPLRSTSQTVFAQLSRDPPELSAFTRALLVKVADTTLNPADPVEEQCENYDEIVSSLRRRATATSTRVPLKKSGLLAVQKLIALSNKRDCRSDSLMTPCATSS